MKNTFLFVIATAILIYGAWWQYQLVQNMKPVEVTTPAPPPPADPKASASPTHNDVSASLPTPQNAEEQRLIEDEQKSREDTEKMLALDVDEFDPGPLWKTLPEPGSNDGSMLVTLNRSAIAGLVPGDPLPLPDIEGQHWQATVTGRDSSPGGNLILKGQLQAWSENYPVTITQGEQHTYATIATPKGMYELEAKGNRGKLRSTSSYDKLIDPEKTDVLPAPSH